MRGFNDQGDHMHNCSHELSSFRVVMFEHAIAGVLVNHLGVEHGRSWSQCHQG